MSLDVEQLPDGRLVVTLESLVPDLRDRAAALNRAGWELLAYAGHKPGPDDSAPFYWGEREDGISERWFLEDNAELDMSAEQVKARRIPTPEEVARGFWWLSGAHDGFEFDESDPEGVGVVMLYGRTHDGLRIAVKVRIESVEQVDF